MSNSYKQEVLEKLSLIHDEPDEESELFQFNKFAKQLAELLIDKKTHTPFSISLHGEWGSGKTSVMKQTYNIVQNSFKKSDNKVIWFDAWEYERLDPVSALFQKIISVYEGKSKKFKEIVKGLALVFSDLALRANTGMNLETFEKYFESSVKEIPLIRSELENLIGDNRLVIIIDDLDRCHIDNTLNILESIKLFLNAKGAIFVIGVDKQKLERAWQLRYNLSEISMLEGKEHVDKIFQLQLTLPPKEEKDITNYVERLASSLSMRDRAFIVNGCPPNPRKIKRVLNLIYFLVKNTPNNDFEKQLSLIIIWSIISSLYPKLAKIISREPNTLVQMVMLSLTYNNYEDLFRIRDDLVSLKSRSGNLTMLGTAINHKEVYPSTIEGFIHIIDEKLDAFRLLREIGNYYGLNMPSCNDLNELQRRLKDGYSKIGIPLTDVIYRSGLIGFE